MDKKIALVAGATGIIGSYLLKHLSSLGDWEAIGLSRRIPEEKNDLNYLSVDLTDYEDCIEKFKNLGPITHIFFAAYQDFPMLSPEQVEVNGSMLKNIVLAAENVSDSLKHVLLMQGGKVYGAHLGEFKTPAKETDPRHLPPNFYYTQEDFLREHQPGKKWSWTILRPDVVVGISTGNPMNVSAVIAVYAAIFKELELPLKFPGKKKTYSKLAQITDASLLARAAEWAATNEQCKLETFNVTNGDFFRWNTIWPKLAEFFEMDLGPVQTLSLSDTMPLQKDVWEKIVDDYHLAPVPYEKVASWSFGDFVFSRDYDVMADTTKIKQFGFTEVLDSEKVLLDLLQEFKDKKLIP